jgi:hypothetical protein
MLYGAYVGHASREPPSADVHPQVTMQRNLVRLGRGCVTWGFQMGSFAAVLLGSQAYLSSLRGRAEWFDTAAAGAGTAGLFGLLSAPVSWFLASPRAERSFAEGQGAHARLRGLGLGLALGGALGAPLGLLQVKLQELAHIEQMERERTERKPLDVPPPVNAAAATIEVLEASLRR